MLFSVEPMTTLIKNGRIITATDDYVADVFIDVSAGPVAERS